MNILEPSDCEQALAAAASMKCVCSRAASAVIVRFSFGRQREIGIAREPPGEFGRVDDHGGRTMFSRRQHLRCVVTQYRANNQTGAPAATGWREYRGFLAKHVAENGAPARGPPYRARQRRGLRDAPPCREYRRWSQCRSADAGHNDVVGLLDRRQLRIGQYRQIVIGGDALPFFSLAPCTVTNDGQKPLTQEKSLLQLD